jgi:hypothetical protein
VPDNKLSAKEAAMIAQVRAELGTAPPAQVQSAVPPARVDGTPAAAAIEPVAPALGAAERAAELMAAARAESERLRRRRHQLYVWAPIAFIAAVVLWTLLWVWHGV